LQRFLKSHSSTQGIINPGRKIVSYDERRIVNSKAYIEQQQDDDSRRCQSKIKANPPASQPRRYQQKTQGAPLASSGISPCPGPCPVHTFRFRQHQKSCLGKKGGERSPSCLHHHLASLIGEELSVTSSNDNSQRSTSLNFFLAFFSSGPILASII